MRTILLAHGLFGFGHIGELDYFNGVRTCWPNGNEPLNFLVPTVAPTGGIDQRAKALRNTIANAFTSDQLKAGKVVHVVAHSMGGLDARYLISSKGLNCGSWIRSLTTISTPHRGSPLADVATGQRILSITEVGRLIFSASIDNVRSVLRAIGQPEPEFPLIPLEAFAPTKILAAAKDLQSYLQSIWVPPVALGELTTSFTKDFNDKHPTLEGVPLLCYAGVSRPDLTMSRAFYLSWALLQATSGENDGVVPASSSSFGAQVRTIPADHLEEVGLAQFVDGLPPMRHFDISGLYLDIDAFQRTIDAVP
jgi:triacylglycerol lipase